MKKKIWLITIAAALLAFAVFWLWPRPLRAVPYSVGADVTDTVRIVQLTDLHSRQFGEENADLIALVAAQEPDLIFVTGDMLNRRETDFTELCALISSLTDIAPVYYSYGNHEVDQMSRYGTALGEALRSTGAEVLDFEYRDVEVNGQLLRIGGYSGFYRTPHLDTKDTAEQQTRIQFADDFEDTERQKLLLCHVPTSWLDWGRIDANPAGIVFSGHNHGGLIRIPLLNRGMYAPYVRWFPKYTRGVFNGERAVCVLSAGLGSGKIIPRVYNPPEILTVELVPENK